MGARAHPASPQRCEQQLRAAGAYVDVTWALVLHELPGHRTRLLVRIRANYAPPAIRMLALPLGLFDAAYGVAMLRLIARRPAGGTVVPPSEPTVAAARSGRS